MPDPTGESPASHEGTDPPILPLNISEDQLSIYIANTAHLVLHKLRKEMDAKISKEVARLRIDHEKRWEETRKQLADNQLRWFREYVRMDTITPEELAR